MKRLVLAILCAIAVVGAFTASASAWVQDGRCRLHAYTPSDQLGGIAAHGRIDTCGGLTGQSRMQLEVCLQVRGALGTAYFVGSCDTGPEVVALSEDVWSHVYYGAVRGHLYRSWVEGDTGGSTARYWSSWITYYG